MSRMVPPLLLTTLLLAMPAAAEGDHDRIRRAVQEGTILPLSAILDRAEQEHGGRMIEAELEAEHGRLVYEIKLLTTSGRVLKLHYDAGTGEPMAEKR